MRIGEALVPRNEMSSMLLPSPPPITRIADAADVTPTKRRREKALLEPKYWMNRMSEVLFTLMKLSPSTRPSEWKAAAQPPVGLESRKTTSRICTSVMSQAGPRRMRLTVTVSAIGRIESDEPSKQELISVEQLAKLMFLNWVWRPP